MFGFGYALIFLRSEKPDICSLSLIYSNFIIYRVRNKKLDH
ncbi:Uncharacterized protein dnm_062220 [Desulfonema magnum]|uniref:Uncharacterized protein n=1 Tax=Desulfonema magnum TaxID=45655 RepID=A0A975GQL3_9BACT|nr:Uncharacterized protein dnm_062220 [Desulfonema magnum]